MTGAPLGFDGPLYLSWLKQVYIFAFYQVNSFQFVNVQQKRLMFKKLAVIINGIYMGKCKNNYGQKYGYGYGYGFEAEKK